ncbi:hypothetical protein GJ654_03695 [Rhodoblastus acidophilus]|uniref:Uncharacterized protein n=1 Tax=Rhodoblastus acidophilus TaxID=1074 RepID=A0A6N8DMT6_RHOAC|nr:hypothetical protein [Rhodoblastus acidophilus]MCW2273198.1 hypothetical protein [Rhodoblastus acidophilus]MTV30094.1 hypothetical protein [Rhodoblastus acidophilus]
MDVEKGLRAELIAALSIGFDCWEHVPVRHVVFTDHVLVADVVAIPHDQDFSGLTFAFEVKNPTVKKVREPPYWTRAIHQAADYVYATPEAGSGIEQLAGRRISCAFIFPTNVLANPDIRTCGYDEVSDYNRIQGAFEVAVHSKVGKARWEKAGRVEKGRLDLWLGNDVWRSDVGFRTHAPGILRGKRALGSRQVDILGELDGIDVQAVRKSGILTNDPPLPDVL